MKALSIRQPWASMIVYGFKPVENRSWRSHYRGPLLIHAGKKYDHEGENWIINNLDCSPEMLARIKQSQDLRGGIIGSVNMVDCVSYHESPWYAGDCAFVFTDPKPMDFRACRGKLNFFDVPEDN